ncbi:MAG: calcium/sodium antiporter [Bacteroidales bacterium]|nr:calcium/sodium antiporter [Bacteroidales bacterium]
MIVHYITFAAGFVILILGANYLVEGASSLGRKLNMSSIIIGFTIVAAGTSLPELIINIFASISKKTDLAIANVVGSNTMNTLLVIGAAALIFPIVPSRRTVYTFLPISLLAALLLAFFAWINFSSDAPFAIISRWEGIFFLALFIGFLVFSMYYARTETESDVEEVKEFTLKRSLLYVIAGIAGLYFGGEWVMGGVNHLMVQFGLSQAIVGIAIVAVITSLPELVTSILAAFKKNSGIALGNALGSNIVNVFLVLGVSSVITPLHYSSLLNLDVTLMALANLAVFFFVIVGKGRQINRLEGFIMMLIYFSYFGFLIWRG